MNQRSAATWPGKTAAIAALLAFEVAGGWFLLRHPVGVVALTLVAVLTVAAALRPALARALSLVGLAVLVAGAWTVSLQRARYGDATGVGFIEWFDQRPTISYLQSDPELYRVYIRDSRSQGYYRTVRDALTYANSIRQGKVDTGSTTAFREPALYVALSFVPTGTGIVIAALVLATAALLAAWRLGSTFGSPSLALASAAALSGHLAAVSSSTPVLDTETWAGMLVLVALAFAVARAKSPRSAFALHSAAAVCGLAAACVRELAAPVLLLGLAVAALDPGMRRRRIWIPWAIASGVFAVAYAVHLQEAARYLVPVTGVVSGFAVWFHPDASGLTGTVAVIRSASGLAPLAAWALFMAGVVGSLVAPRDHARRLLLCGVTVGGAALLLLLRSSATDAITGEPMNTWGALLTPTVLAAAPLVLSKLKALG